MGTFTSSFPNQYRVQQGWKLWSLLLLMGAMLLNVQIITRPIYISTVQKYIYPSVIIWMRILKVQVNGPIPKGDTLQIL